MCYKQIYNQTIMYKIGVLLCLIVALTYANPESKLLFPEYCIYHGYPTETHIIHTKDLYNLKFFRLQAKNSVIQPRRKVVYLQHGLQDSSDTWVVNSEHLAPGFILANQGYDVWVGNVRGNFYSNPTLNSRVKNFWDFSFDEMAKYDLPAAFQYIFNITKQKIHYIGHSQGTTIMFAALADGNSYVKSHIASFSALGPVAYLQNQQSKLLGSLAKTPLIKILNNSEVKQIFYTKQSTRIATSLLCYYDRYLCTLGLSKISQKNNTVNNLQRLPVIMAHFPSGSSLRNMDHFHQIMKNKKFAKYDFGAVKNQIIYGTKVPPVYNLTRIQFPVHLFVGQYDKLADVKDADKLYLELGSKIKTKKLLKFGHATFIWGKDVTYLQDLIQIIEQSNEELIE